MIDQGVATPMELDFRHINNQMDPLPIPAIIDQWGHAKKTSRSQLRARVRRKKNGFKSREFKQLYKPVEEWDAEELARGRPKDRDGAFRGVAPKWITREAHEEAVTRFRAIVRDEMNAHTTTALLIIQKILTDEERDDKGRPLTPSSTKLDAAKFLVEHVLGKPKQHTETDISVRLQGLLATSVIVPDAWPAVLGAKELTSPRDPAIDAPGWEVEEDDDD